MLIFCVATLTLMLLMILYLVINRTILALSCADVFGDVGWVFAAWRVVQQELVKNVHLSIRPDLPAHRLVGEFCKLMDHSDSVTVWWTPPVFTSHVSVTCVFMRASRLHCGVRWQSIPGFAFPIRLLLSGILWLVFMCLQLFWDQLITSTIVMLFGIQHHCVPNEIWSVQMPLLLV